jgi:hypothetical protein
MSADTYGHGIDEVIEKHCGSYDSADYVRLAMATATDLWLTEQLTDEQLTGLEAWLMAPVSHTAILSADAAALVLQQHDYSGIHSRDIESALSAVARANLRCLCLAALDQAGMSVRGQEHVRALLRGAA